MRWEKIINGKRHLKNKNDRLLVKWLVIISVVLLSCTSNYKHQDLIGEWKVIEIKSSENAVSNTFLGAETVSFSEDGKYTFPKSINEKGEWTIVGNKLRLHSNSVKDMRGDVVYEGHDSEWVIDKSDQFMIWRGTSRFHNQDLRVMFEKR